MAYVQTTIFDYLAQPIQETQYQVEIKDIHSLMKEKFNIDNKKLSGKLNRTINDNLGTCFSKLAKYLGNNSIYTRQEVSKAITEISPYLECFSGLNYEGAKETRLSTTNKSALDYLNSRKSLDFVYELIPKRKMEAQFLLFTGTSLGNKVGQLYHFSSNRSIHLTFFPDKFILGASKVIDDLKKSFLTASQTYNYYSTTNFSKILMVLIEGKSFKIDAYKTLYPIEYKFIAKYIYRSFNLISEYNHALQVNTMLHAKAWQKKKNVNKTILQTVEHSILLDTFSEVELDNEVDLNKFHELEKDFENILAFLPKYNVKPILRFRKIQNHKAYGVFFPINNTIALDFRDENDNVGLNEPGITAFIHEYAHFLDYNYQGNGIESNLSFSEDFEPILNKVIAKYLEMQKALSLTPKQLNYFTRPTEIFARCFELYFDSFNLKTNLKHKTFANSKYIPILAAVSSEEIGNYFSNLFPEMNKKKKTLLEK